MSEGICYVREKILKDLRKQVKAGKEMTRELVGKLAYPYNVALIDPEETMVPVALTELGYDSVSMDEMIEELGAKGAAEAFIAAEKRFKANRKKMPADVVYQPMTAKAWKKLEEETFGFEDEDEDGERMCGIRSMMRDAKRMRQPMGGLRKLHAPRPSETDFRDALEACPAGTPRARSRSRSPRGHADGLPTDLASLTVVAIKDALRERGLPVGGKKAELVSRLNRARRGESQASRSAPASAPSQEPPRVSMPAPAPVFNSGAPPGRHNSWPATPSTSMPHEVQVPAQPLMNLRPPWVGCIDMASGKPFAFNGWTNETFWYPPSELPLGWELFWEPTTGKPYYFNRSTNPTRYAPPPA